MHIFFLGQMDNHGCMGYRISINSISSRLVNHILPTISHCKLSNHFCKKTMEMDLTPRTSQAVYEGECRCWLSRASTQCHFALPHYADSSKVGCVLQGTDGVVGMLVPNTGKEVVLKLKKGDVVLYLLEHFHGLTFGSFLGETSKAQIPGQFSYFFLTGTQGLMRGFSTEVTSKAYNLSKDDANKLTESQKGSLIIKLPKDQALAMPIPQMDMTNELDYNIDAACPDNAVKNGGSITTITEAEFPFVGQVGLCVTRVKLEPNAIKAPGYIANTAVQLIYIARGNVKVEIVGLNGKRELESKVNAGHLLLVPQFFALAVTAGGEAEGMEYYSMVTTKQPVFEELAGNSSIWEAISPAVQQVALNADPEFQKLFLSKIHKTTNLIPSTN